MRFCTVINCIDGRVQLPVISYLQKRFNVKYVDSITEAGPNLILSEQKNTVSIQSILERLRISIENHNSVGVAIIGHHDCAGNPAPQDDQIMHIQKAIQLLRQQYKSIEIIGLWVDNNWKVHEVIENKSSG
ncbi:MAG: carbonic anhydrase [Nitrospinota bacterium]